MCSAGAQGRNRLHVVIVGDPAVITDQLAGVQGMQAEVVNADGAEVAA